MFGTALFFKEVVIVELTIDRAKAIVSNIKKAAEEKSIDFLNRPAYQFITMKMGFIAHHDLHGFMEVYRGLRKFLLGL